MLKELFEKGYLNYHKLIIDNAKPLSLKTGEVIVLIKILDIFLYNRKLTIKDIRENLLMSKGKLDAALSSLMERSFYEIYISYDDGEGQEYISLDCLFNKLEALLSQNNVNHQDELTKCHNLLVRTLNRVLTATEIEILTSIVNEDGHNYDEVEEACNYLSSINRNVTMRTLVQALNRGNKREEKKEVPTSVKNFFNSVK